MVLVTFSGIANARAELFPLKVGAEGLVDIAGDARRYVIGNGRGQPHQVFFSPRRGVEDRLSSRPARTAASIATHTRSVSHPRSLAPTRCHIGGVSGSFARAGHPTPQRQCRTSCTDFFGVGFTCRATPAGRQTTSWRNRPRWHVGQSVTAGTPFQVPPLGAWTRRTPLGSR